MGNHRSSTVLGILALAVLATGCPTVDLGDSPSDIGLCNPQGGIQYFTDHIWPDFVRPTNTTNGCTKTPGCHGEAGGNLLSFKTQPVDFGFNYRQTQIYLNCGTPMASELLTRPLAGTDPHGGMDIFQPSDPAVMIFIDWFN